MPPFYGISTSILKNYNDKTCFFIDMFMPSDTNLSRMIFEKLSKYKDLQREITKMWHLKTTALAVVIGALGMVAKTALNYDQIPGAQSLTELPEITLMSTAHIPRKVL